MKPIRIRLLRQKGFNFRNASLALNGLQAVRVARPGRWGNPYVVGFDGTPAQCVALFQCRFMERLSNNFGGPTLLKELAKIRGKNLACWSKLDEPCHADVLLELANK
jgi:hypothetical protein